MNLRSILRVFVISCCSLSLHAQSVWDRNHLTDVKQSVQDAYYAASLQELKTQADGYLKFGADTVDTQQPLSGVECESSCKRVDMISDRITTLALAYFFNEEEIYAQKAVELIRTNFLDKNTRMTPDNFDVLETYPFIEMLDAVQLLEASSQLTSKDAKRLKAWFADLLDGMQASSQEVDAKAWAGHRGTAYDAQVIAYALYIGKKEVADKVIESIPAKRIFKQIEPSGKQPYELDCKHSFDASQRNLHYLIDICLMAKHRGLQIDGLESSDGRSLYDAMDYLAQFAGKDVSEWPYRQDGGWDCTQQKLYQDLYRAAVYLDTNRRGYLKVYDTHRIIDWKDRFNLLYAVPSSVDNAFAFACRQLDFAIAATNKTKKQKDNICKRKVMPRSIAKDGSLALVSPYDWCSGFFPGSLWHVYAYTNNDYWRQQAISFTWPLEEVKRYKSTHDLGFMVNNSFGKAYQWTGERSYKDVVIQAAKTLVSRYDDRVKCIRSWDFNRDRWKYPVIIDNMMNLEMLFSATQLTGDSLYWRVAVNHANTTMKNHFRSDYSSYHVVDYDPATGAARMKCTYQGYSDDSFWSRGQGWGLYGYTLCYRFTKETAYLRQAEAIADFILSWSNMPEDGVPYWDMKAPGIPDVPRDASAAAIIASGLYELSEYADMEKGKKYKAAADKIIDSLNRSYQSEYGANYGFLLLHSTGSAPHKSEVDVPLSYADYYYLEALWRKRSLDN